MNKDEATQTKSRYINSGTFKKNHIVTLEMRNKIGVGNRNKKRSLELRQRISETQQGKHHSPTTEFKKGQNIEKDNTNWQGDKVKYSGLHMWIRKNLGQPDTCKKCQKTKLKGKNIHWANVSHKYTRNINDWIRLCTPCHKNYDISYRKEELSHKII